MIKIYFCIASLDEVTSENAYGCDSIITVDLIFRDCSCYIYLPNVFTPNNDGNNDHFQPVFNCNIDEYSISIYDRWGNLVYTSSDPNSGWDGRFTELPAESGVYTYLFVSSAPEDTSGAEDN